MEGPKDTHPSPIGFEGFEKRLEVEFFPVKENGNGLRSLSRELIDSVLTVAQCTIVSELSNEFFDSYVLSESSLFIYPHKIVIKTCGTTQLLKAIPQLLSVASQVGLSEVARCKYTRGTFMFPQVQPFPHRSFDEEVNILDKHFSGLGEAKHFIMGDGLRQWHVYVASSRRLHKPEPKVYTLEICMTDLDKSITGSFFKSDRIVTGEDMTRASGINFILPGSTICDFAFDPCGYSMNGMEGGAHSTIHITPEDGFSYASFECMGYDPDTTDLNKLVGRVLDCFKPRFVSVSIHGTVTSSCSTWERPISIPSGYLCSSSNWEAIPGGGSVVYHTFTNGECSAQVPVKPLVSGKVGKSKLEVGYFEGGGFILTTRDTLVELLRDHIEGELFKRLEEGGGGHILIVAETGKVLTGIEKLSKISSTEQKNCGSRLGRTLNQLLEILEKDEILEYGGQ